MLRKLVEMFEDTINLPIEIDEICAALIDMGMQDSIITCPEPMDTGKLLGTFTQYTTSQGVYSAPDFVTLIIYPENAEIPVQRAVCAKELVHVCDKQTRKVHDVDFLNELAQKVVGPFQSSLEDAHVDITASLDVLAQYQGMNLLFPKAARALAREKIKSGEKTQDEIIEWVSAPEGMVIQMLAPEWDEMAERLIEL